MTFSAPLLILEQRTRGVGASQQRSRRDEGGKFEHDNDHHPCHSLSCSSSSTSSSADDDSNTRNPRSWGGNVLLTFPWQIHSMLEAAATEGFDHIVSWLDDNASFKVHEPALFVKQVLPRFFERQSKYKSFQRQLNAWQFERLIGARGPSNGGYCHAHFHRTHTSNFHLIKRLKKLVRCRPSFCPSSSCEQEQSSRLRTSLLAAPDLQIQTEVRQCEQKTRTTCARNSSNRSSGITYLSGLPVSPQPQERPGSVRSLNALHDRGDHTPLLVQEQQHATNRSIAPNLPSRTRTAMLYDPSTSSRVGIAASPVQPTMAGVTVYVQFSKPQSDLDALDKTLPFFSSSASKNVPPPSGMMRRCGQDAQQSSIGTSSMTNDVSGRSNDGNAKLLSPRVDTEKCTPVFPRFIFSGIGNCTKNKNGMLDEDNLVQGLTPTRTGATTRQQKEQDVIILQDEWKYVLLGLRIGASMASAYSYTLPPPW